MITLNISRIGMIEMDDSAPSPGPDDKILDAIDAFFDDFSYLEESQSK
jgi:hypothetical protein